MGSPIFRPPRRKGGSGGPAPWPRQRSLQPPPQGPPLLRQLLVKLCRSSLLRRLVNRRIRCSHSVTSKACLYHFQTFVILTLSLPKGKDLLFLPVPSQPFP